MFGGSSAALPDLLFRLVVAAADDDGVNITDVAIGETEPHRFLALRLTGARFAAHEPHPPHPNKLLEITT
jgi:hypothetical protein